MSVSSASLAARLWSNERTTTRNLRHGLGIGALGLMLGMMPAYANDTDDLQTQQRLDASEEILDHARDEVSKRKAAAVSLQDSRHTMPTASSPDGLAPELLTQMMMSANRQGMQQFSTLSVRSDHVQFIGWGRDGWKMTLSINLADGELLDESLRQMPRDEQSIAIGRDIMRQTLNFAASDGIEKIYGVDVDAGAIRVQGKTREGKLREVSLNMSWLSHTFSLANETSHSVHSW